MGVDYGFLCNSHVGLYVENMEASKKFYVDILGFDILYEWIREWDQCHLVFVKKENCIIELVQKAFGKPSYDSVLTSHIAIEVADIRKAVEVLQKQGVIFESREPFCDEGLGENGMYWIFLRGPSGERIQLVEGH